MDYEKLGLRVGLEIHQQLATRHKLFCNCPIIKTEEFPIEIKRKLRPVVGELGEYDPAVLYEYLRNRIFIYKSNSISSCLVELDEDPPKNLNKEALEIALQVCKLLRCNIVDEVYVMRKTVIDGSAVTGFQRTSLIGMNGTLETSFGEVGIQTICLEEDSAPVLGKENGKIEYRLDRLGIPLIEVTTTSDIHTPEHAKEVAGKIGLLLRSTNVARGIGTIRQDINISIKDGERIEIKGFQELEKIPKVINNEVVRQLCLLEIKQELQKRGMKERYEIKNTTDIFKNTRCNFIKKAKFVYAAKLPNFGGLLKKQCGDRTFGKELSSYAAAYGYVIIHSDEYLNKYNLDFEFKEIRKKINADENDLILIVAGNNPEKAINAVIERAKFCSIGIPKETRVADGVGSKYTRPLPGSERMYPESDIPPIIISNMIKQIKTPKTLLEKEKELKKILPEDMAEQMIKSIHFPLFEKLINRYKIDPKIIASTFLSTMKDLRRQGFAVDSISKENIGGIFRSIEQERISKDSISQILELLSKGTKFNEAIDKYEKLSEKKLRKIIREIINNNSGLDESALMGLAMSRVRGKADGKKVIELLRKEMK